MNDSIFEKAKKKFWFLFYEALGHLSTKKLVELRYKRKYGKRLDWSHPVNLNEKILWLKYYTDTTEWTRLADKFLVREYVISKGLSDILVELYGKWNRVEDIDWDALPDSFVMKMNNGSGDVLVCKDKSELDVQQANALFRRLLKHRFGYTTGEPHYRAIKPCIIAEELLDHKKQSIPTFSLIDYKIWCFDGKPYSVWCCYNRSKKSVEVAEYDLQWNRHPEFSNYTDHYIKALQDVPRPQSFERMLEIASILSEGFPEVRVDLYEVEGKPYFGEMTFSSNYGMMDFYTEDYNKQLGSQVKLDMYEIGKS